MTAVLEGRFNRVEWLRAAAHRVNQDEINLIFGQVGKTMQTASHVSRRALLSGAAASLALPLLPRATRAQSTGPNWGELNNMIMGGVQQPNDPRFVWLTQPENLRYYNPPATPGGRARPRRASRRGATPFSRGSC